METHKTKSQYPNLNKKLVLQITLPLTLFTLITLQLAKNISIKTTSNPIISNLYIHNQHNYNYEDPFITSSSSSKCDLFNGEWIPNMDAPYYTNETCWVIQEHQNCMKYGRPDTEFMKWKWKPDGCELPVFDPFKFLEIVKDKTLAFVGDSVARNHMQSLICLLSRVNI